MNNPDFFSIFERCREVSSAIEEFGGIPEEGLRAESHLVLAVSLTRGTRGYIEKIANQINGSYGQGWFDACAVMIRRLLETLIIECFEAYGISQKIKDSRTGDFMFLRDLITATLNEAAWNLGRNTRRALPKLKDIGDKSAHSRRFTATKADIVDIRDDFRVVVQELLYLARLK
jgi:hypothetical protein